MKAIQVTIMYQIVVGHYIESIQVTINGMYTGDNNVPNSGRPLHTIYAGGNKWKQP